MTSTMELRFVERIIYVNAAWGELKYEQKRLILQQKWVADYETMDESGNYSAHTEWRDVPVEREPKV